MATGRPIACVALPLPAEVRQRIEAVATIASPGQPATRDGVLTTVTDAEGFLGSAVFPIDTGLLDAAPRLRVIANFGVGFNNVDVADATRRGIAVCNTPGVLSDAVADLTLGLILGVARNLVANAGHVRGARWGKSPPPPLGFDVGGRTLGIVGFGRIGRAVATRARAFGMQVLFHDVFRDPGALGAFCAYRDLDALLRESDVVTLHVNLSPETHHLIGGRELALMKPSAIIVNTSRGPVIDQAALAAALDRGVIGGAALDVLEVEPPAADDAILAAPNALILPHVGSATVETRAAMMDLAVSNLVAVLSGQQPRECVNPEALPRAIQRR